jgi:hypothetical protein
MTHACLNAQHCQPGDKPRTTDAPNTLCPPCLSRARRRTADLPPQHLALHARIGEHLANPNPRHTQPESGVLINTTIDTLLTNIEHTTTLAAEIIADLLHTTNPYHHDATAHVAACCQLTAPNLHKLQPLHAIDVMEFGAGRHHHTITTITGVTIIQRLDRLAALAHYTLGYTRTRHYRDLPCARCGANTVGRWTGADCYDCQTCGTQWPEATIRNHDRILLERHKRGLLNA